MNPLAITLVIFLYLLFAIGLAQIVWELPVRIENRYKAGALFVGFVWPLFLGFAGVLAVYRSVDALLNGKRKEEE